MNIDNLTEGQAKVIAKGFAYVHNREHKYLPRTSSEALYFDVHNWVIQALIHAYKQGQVSIIKTQGDGGIL